MSVIYNPPIAQTVSYPNLFPKQNEYINAFLDPRFQFLLYGGAMGGGKTYLTIGIIDELCRQYPGARFAVIRKSLSVLVQNTIPSLNKILEANADDKIEAKVTYGNRPKARYSNGSEILFIDADITKDPELNRLKGLEITGALIEEANEVEEQVFTILIGRIGRWKPLGIKPFILLTCNPDNNWVKTKFYDPWENGSLEPPFYYLPALPHDNLHLSKEYLNGLEFMPEAEYMRYVKGNWNYAANKNQLFLTQHTKDATVDYDLSHLIPKYVGIDYAREGDDSTSLCFGNDQYILWYERYKYETAGPIADILEERIEQYNIDPDFIAVDGIGNGPALWEALEAKRIEIGIYKSSEAPLSVLPHFKFKNRRAEAHWLLKQDIQTQALMFNHNKDFFRESQVIKYFIKDKYIQIESKDDIKKTLGNSPDTLDSAVIFNYIRNKNTTFGSVPTNFISTVYKQQLRKTLGRRKYLTSVKQMIY